MKAHLNITSLVATLLVMAAKPACGQGIVAQHFGYADPTTEGFSSSGQTNTGPVTGDLGENAWYTVGDSRYYYVLTSQQQMEINDSNWTLSTVLRSVTPGSFGDFSIDLIIGFHVYILYLGTESDGDPAVSVSGSSLSPTFILNNVGSSYNNYQLMYNASQGTASLWINGTDMLNNIVGGTTSLQYDELLWGGVQPPNVQANWNLVSLTVPEPSASWLLLLGGGVFLYVRTRKQRGPR